MSDASKPEKSFAATLVCERKACGTPLIGAYVKIWNQPTHHPPHRCYCTSCARKIIHYNPGIKFENAQWAPPTADQYLKSDDGVEVQYGSLKQLMEMQVYIPRPDQQGYRITYQTRVPGEIPNNPGVERRWELMPSPIKVYPVYTAGFGVPNKQLETAEECFHRVFKATFGDTLECRVVEVETLPLGT